MKILYVQQELRNWQSARMWSYHHHLGFEEGLRANGVEVTTLMSSWMPRARELLGNQTFDQVWFNDVTHHLELGGPEWYRLTFDDFEWLCSLAPVRVGLVIEALGYAAEHLRQHPWLHRARNVVSLSSQFLSHLLYFDEKDEEFVRSLPCPNSLWYIPAIPEGLVLPEPARPPSTPPVFFGSVYGDRARWLQDNDLRSSLTHRVSKDNLTDIPARFDRLHAELDEVVRRAPLEVYARYLDEVRALRRRAEALYLESWLEGAAVVNLPSWARTYTGAYEGFALGRPVIAPFQRGNAKLNAVFRPEEEILVYDPTSPRELKAQIQRVMTDPDFGWRIARNAHQKLRKGHTIEVRVRQYLDWITTGRLPAYYPPTST